MQPKKQGNKNSSGSRGCRRIGFGQNLKKVGGGGRQFIRASVRYGKDWQGGGGY